MPRIIWEKADTFTFGEGMYGVVLNPETAVLIKQRMGKGQGWIVEKGGIPENAVPAAADGFHYEAQMAIQGTLAVIT